MLGINIDKNMLYDVHFYLHKDNVVLGIALENILQFHNKLLLKSNISYSLNFLIVFEQDITFSICAVI